MSSASTPRLLARSLANADVPLVSWWVRRKEPKDPLETSEPKMSRRSLGMRAELAAIEARAKAHEQRAELDLAGSCWAELARAQLAQKSRYDLAIRCARRALELKEDAALREELAAWLEGVGQWQQAATLLSPAGEPRADSDRLRLFRRVASLHWRSGQTEQAVQALAEIARIDPNSTEPLESLAAVHSYAQDVVSRERAVLAQLEAARRLQQHGARLLAFEAELRASEIDPGSLPATERLAATLTKLGRPEAADDVWRECARAANDRSLHRHLVETALNRDEPERALIASLDALDDALLDIDAAQTAAEFALNTTGTAPKTFDGILARTGLHGWLAARLDVAIAEDRTLRNGSPRMGLTRLYASVMGRTDWAIESLNQAILVEPRSTELRRMLEASTPDAPDGNDSLRALVNAARIARAPDSQSWLATEFIERHRRGLNEPSILVWALRTKRRESLAGSIEPSALAEWQSRRTEEQAEWQRRWLELTGRSHAEKTAEFQRLAAKMALDPEAFESLRDVCLEWLKISENAVAAVEQLARLVDALTLNDTHEDPSPEWRAAFTALVQTRSERACLAVARYWLRRANAVESLAGLAPALDHVEPSQRLLGWAITLARRLVDKRLFANSMTALAKTTDAAVGTTILVQAAEVYAELGDHDAARRIVHVATVGASHLARLSALEIKLLDPSNPRIVTETLERALGVVPPRVDYALQLSESHERLGNSELALAWALRASTLRPGALALRDRVASLAIIAKDAARLTDWLVQALEVPLVASMWLPTAARVLRTLTEIDAQRAAEVSRRLVGALGAQNSEWRAALLACADSVADARLAIDILERAAARQPQNADVLKDIVRRNLKLGDTEAAFSAALRALKAGSPPSVIRKWLPNLEAESYEIPGTELAAAELVRELALAESEIGIVIQSGRRLALDKFRLANDEQSALQLWSDLLKLDHPDVVDWVAEDLAHCFGNRPAALYLRQAVEQAPNARAKARLYAASAHLSAQMGDHDIARVHVEQSLSNDSGNIRALFIAESLANDDPHQRWLDELYELVVRSTLGSFGERAVHYRAAKVLHGLGNASLALKHACLALIAVPSESTTLPLAATLAREIGNAQSFVKAMLAVVERTKSGSSASRWLDLAQRRLAGSEFLGARIELLLHLLEIEPTAALVETTTEAALLLDARSSERVRTQLTVLLKQKLEKIEGPSGARFALSIAEASARFKDVELCAIALFSALRGDSAIDEYDTVNPAMNWLASHRPNANELLVQALDFLEQPYTNVGLAALRLLGKLQLRAGDAATYGRLKGLWNRIDENDSLTDWFSEVIFEPTVGPDCVVPVINDVVASYLRQQRLDKALVVLATAIQAHPRTRQAYDLAMQAVALLLKQKSLADAQQWVQQIREHLTPVNAATIELDLARMTGETLFLVQALAHRAYSDPSSSSESVQYLVEATELAERLGHAQVALDCARAAVKWDPEHIGARTALGALADKVERASQSEHHQGLRSLEHHPPASDEQDPRLLVSNEHLNREPSGETNDRGNVHDEEGLEIPLVRRRSEQPLDTPNPDVTIDQALISPESDPSSEKEAVERANFMMTHASPSYQTLTLLRRWLRRWPSSTKLMECVRDAAFVERDIPLSRAVEHVRCVLSKIPAQDEPPELGSQPIVPEAVRALLTRDVTSAASEALAVIGDGSERFVQRELSDFGVTGLDRVIPNSATPLGQAFGEVSARLGLLRTPLFYKRGAQPARASLALAAPTALLIEGELPREESELVGLIAGPLWVTQPEYSIIMGAPVQQARTVILALQVAFGPPQRRPPTNYGEALKLAEKLWETVPPAAQRRLRDLCVESLDYARALEFARRVDRRAGLYATGDIGWAIAQLSQQQQRDVLATIADPEVAEHDPNATDLLRLATSAEYAAIRWQPSKGSERRIPVHPR